VFPTRGSIFLNLVRWRFCYATFRGKGARMDSSAAWMLAAGAAAMVLAIVAWIADRLRVRRRELDRVGFMPWTDVFFWSTMLAVLLLGAGGRALL
jgi:uncharacterized membrane protein